MLPFFRNPQRLYPWILAGLAETGVAIPMLLALYSAQGNRAWPEALPGAWLLLLIFLAGALWEAGTIDGEKETSGRSRVIAMLTGSLFVYLIAYSLMPQPFRVGLVSPNLALSILPVSGYLWYQGAVSAADGLDYGRVFGRFTWQILTLVGSILFLYVVGAAADPRVQVLLYWGVLLLFAAGLTLLVAARERSLRSDQAKLGESGADQRSFSPVVTAMLLTLLALTLAASYLLSIERVMALAGALGTLWSFVTSVVMLIVYRWVLLLWLIVGPIYNWVRSKAKPREQQQQPPPEEEQAPDAGTEYDLVRSLDAWMPYIKAALLVAILLLAAVWVYRLSKRARTRTLNDEEERISLGFWSSLLEDLKSLLGQAGQGAAAAASDLADRLGLDPRSPRMLYRRLQAWGEAIGRPRRPGQTPNAYSTALAQHRPDVADPVASVTSVYNQARYSHHQPDAGSVDQAVAAIEALERRQSESKP